MSRFQKFKIEIGQKSVIALMLFDAVAVNLSYFLSLLFQAEGIYSQIDPMHLKVFYPFVPIYAIASVVIFYFCRMYHSVWKYAGFDEMLRAIIGSFFASLFNSVVITVMMSLHIFNTYYVRMPLFYYVFGFCLQGILIVGIRMSSRFFYTRKSISKNGRNSYTERILLIGAGQAGQLLLRAMKLEKEINEKVVCIIDDNHEKWGRFLEGVEIVGGREDILTAVEKYKVDAIYIAIPSASSEIKREILSICSETSCKLKNLPDTYLSMSGKINSGSLRDVSVEDLLGRPPIKADMDEISRFITGKTVLVTGGGGSIGGELCRQIASHNPKLLIIFDVYENNAYDVQFELRNKFPNLNFETLIGSVRDSRRLDDLFKKYHPDIVYHAAAHKHVPLIEDSPCEAIKNNVIGTYKTAYAAMMNGCKRFVLVSTDKAVNPVNVMGASKRLCEMVIQSFDRKIKEGKVQDIVRLFTHSEEMGTVTEIPDNIETEFVAVRFGNVLGSHGSVVPLFKKQIEMGGPVTVTHPEIIRYFMTIPEAVSLVLLAGTYAKGGEIFIFDMGEPVKIDTLAKNLIKLSGLRPGVDIKIDYIGLRPGEKLFEEKLMAEEGLRKTANDLIHIANPVDFDADWFQGQLQKLMDASYANDENIRELIKETVTTYVPNCFAR